MTLECHPDAEANFERRANELLSKLEICPPQSSPPPKSSRSCRGLSDLHAITPDSIVGPIRIGRVDRRGSKTAQYFYSGEQEVGLAGEDYRQFQLLAESIQRTPGWYEVVSVRAIEAEALNWLHARHEKRHGAPLLPYLRDAIRPTVRRYQAWVPLAHTTAQRDYTIGRTVLRPILPEHINQWQQSMKAAREEDKARFDEYLRKLGNQLVSLAAATIEIEAEPGRAMDVALQKAEETASILRLYSPLMCEPELVSRCVPLGRESRPTELCLLLEGPALSMSRSALVDGALHQTVVDDKHFALMNSLGLPVLNDILARPDKTRFQQQLLTALSLYARSSLERDQGTRLVWVFAAIESLLLRSESEPIVQNVSERIAFLVSKDPHERRAIARNAKEVYDLRSRFLHHGAAIQEIEKLSEFLHSVWLFFISAIKNANSIDERAQLIDHVEDKKFE